MKNYVLIIVLCFSLLTTCGCSGVRHTGTIVISDGKAVVTLDRPMMMEMTQDGTTVKVDSRGQSSWGDFVNGIFKFAGQVLTLGLLTD